MKGEYKEKLPGGNGELIVSEDSWKIRYYFPGIDLRHNGTFLNISQYQVDNYIDAFKNNWQKYKALKESPLSSSGEVRVAGEMNMVIHAGGHFDGVCILSYHMPLKTEEEINAVIEDYNWAAKRATNIMELLKQIE